MVEADLQKSKARGAPGDRERRGGKEPEGCQRAEEAKNAKLPKGKTLEALELAVRKAYLAFQYAETKKERRLQDKEAWEFLKENGLDEKGDLGEMTDYNLPAFDTWSRQVREARKHLNESKYRTGRHSRSRSIVESREIERQHEENA